MLKGATIFLVPRRSLSCSCICNKVLLVLPTYFWRVALVPRMHGHGVFDIIYGEMVYDQDIGADFLCVPSMIVSHLIIYITSRIIICGNHATT